MNYMSLARAAIDHVDSLKMRSNNRSFRLDGVCDRAGRALGVAANMQFGAILGELIDEHPALADDTLASALVAPVLAGRKLRFGNCEARAGEAFLYLAKQGVYPLECMAVVNGDSDHVFVVLGRDQATAIPNGQWNADAVICDPWARSCYKASLLREQLALPIFQGIIDPPPYEFVQTCERPDGPWPPKALRHVPL